MVEEAIDPEGSAKAFFHFNPKLDPLELKELLALHESFEEYALLVRQQERFECIKIADQYAQNPNAVLNNDCWEWVYNRSIQDKIRERGKSLE